MACSREYEHWLTRAGERSYEIAFAQLLLAEGWRILHGPVHHPYEHGKDIAAMDPDGRLCGIQLKDGDVSLADFEKYQGQLTALSRTAITYPGIEPPRLPDRVLFVTNGVLTPPARNRIEALNSANRSCNPDTAAESEAASTSEPRTRTRFIGIS